MTTNARQYIETLTGDEDPLLEAVDLCDVIAYEIERQRDTAEHARFEVLTDVPSATVMANEMLRSVFRNLLGNAVQLNRGSDPVVELACVVE